MLLKGDCLEELKKIPKNSVDALVTDPPAGIGFLNKAWDEDKGGRDNWVAWMKSVMEECNRVMKPGAHAVVWALPRTSHWTARAVEDAGFEIRDIIHHTFSNGFGKGINLGKSVDKKLGNKREIIGTKKSGIGTGKEFGSNQLERGLKGKQYEVIVDKGNSPFEGFNTTLKPAVEHWILARKKIKEATVTAQLLKNGCGGLDIEKCKLPARDKKLVTKELKKGKNFLNSLKYGVKKRSKHEDLIDAQGGRMPTNFLFDNEDCNTETAGYFDINLWAKKRGVLQIAKPSRAERDIGLESFAYKQKWGKAGGGAAISDRESVIAKNIHPTLKPIKLMAWLITLISKENDTVLDCFMGSGTTGVTCKLLKRNFIGIEKDPEYFAIAEARIKNINPIDKTKKV